MCRNPAAKTVFLVERVLFNAGPARNHLSAAQSHYDFTTRIRVGGIELPARPKDD